MSDRFKGFVDRMAIFGALEGAIDHIMARDQIQVLLDDAVFGVADRIDMEMIFRAVAEEALRDFLPIFMESLTAE